MLVSSYLANSCDLRVGSTQTKLQIQIITSRQFVKIRERQVMVTRDSRQPRGAKLVSYPNFRPGTFA